MNRWAPWKEMRRHRLFLHRVLHWFEENCPGSLIIVSIRFNTSLSVSLFLSFSISKLIWSKPTTHLTNIYMSWHMTWLEASKKCKNQTIIGNWIITSHHSSTIISFSLSLSDVILPIGNKQSPSARPPACQVITFLIWSDLIWLNNKVACLL